MAKKDIHYFENPLMGELSPCGLEWAPDVKQTSDIRGVTCATCKKNLSAEDDPKGPEELQKTRDERNTELIQKVAKLSLEIRELATEMKGKKNALKEALEELEDANNEPSEDITTYAKE